MSFKKRILLVTASTLFLFVACTPDSKEAISKSKSELVEAKVTEKEVKNDLASSVEEDLEDEQIVSENDTDHEKNKENKTGKTSEIEDTPIEEKESMYSVQDRALNQLIAVSHLQKDGYSYHFSDIDSSEFIQIEVREQAKENLEHTPLEGVYRYLLETEEILKKDYLSGEFIPYEPDKS